MFGRGTVEGHAQVLEMSAYGDERRFALKVSVPGKDDYFVDHAERVPDGKAPVLGRVVPVTVSAKHPSKLNIEWSRV